MPRRPHAAALALTALFTTASCRCVSTSEATAAAPGSPAHRLDRLKRWGAEQRGALVQSLADMIAAPSVSRQPEGVARMAEQLTRDFSELGMRVENIAVDGPPLLLITGGPWQARDPETTLLFYAHYDGQNVDATRWRATSPFAPALYPGEHQAGARARRADDPALAGDWRLYGRGAADDKGPIAVIQHVLKGIKELELGPTAIGVKLLLDGEEESGSPHLGAAIEAAAQDPARRARLAADALVSLDGPLYQTGAPTISFGVRGIMTVDLTTYGARRDLHSGHYGNWAPNPALELARVLSTLKDPISGRVLVDGFHDCERPRAPEARAALQALPPIEDALREQLGVARLEGPSERALFDAVSSSSLNVRGLASGDVGERARTVIPAQADAALDLRLVPECTRDGMSALLRRHLEGLGYTVQAEPPSDEQRRAGARVIRMRVRARGYPGVQTPLDLAISRQLRALSERATGEPPVALPTMGGSLPFHHFESRLGMRVLALPLVNHDNNQHGPDENVRVGALWRGFDLLATVALTYGDA